MPKTKPTVESAEEFALRLVDEIADGYTRDVLGDVQKRDADIRADERERCAQLALEVWKSEPDLTTQNALSHGCIAVAEALRVEAESES